MRCFIAIEPPETIRFALLRLSQNLRDRSMKATWVKPYAMHITLRFLGDVTPDHAKAIAESLALSCAKIGPFALRVRGVGAFPSLRRPSVVWAGVEPMDGPLAVCYQAAESAGLAAGVRPESRRFHPHFTLARIKGDGGLDLLRERIEAASGFDAGAFTVTNVRLFKSELWSEGPVYTILNEISL